MSVRGSTFNPYLPLWEYIPDGEPHIFENRLYVYGSHDYAHGEVYCPGDYMGWSAPVNDLGNWDCEGVIYRKEQEALYPEEGMMFAPDVEQGEDGRYYLYYQLSSTNWISVAASDSPSGPFSYYGRVQYEDGSLPAGTAFDPGVLVENGRIYLYYGFSPKEKYPMMAELMPGAYMVELADDMKTVVSSPVLIANGYSSAKGTSFEEHPFFEASSIRHYGNRYYFIYSSLQGHELCYALGDKPEGPFVYKGVLISNGDVGLSDGQRAYTANNHGSLVEIEGKYYIFYHRHTHGTHFSRQGCAEPVTIAEDGSIAQVEMTSCGLNQGPLPANQKYPAAIICNLHGPRPAGQIPSKPPYDPDVPFLEETREMQKENRLLYLKNMQNGAVCGVKYLEFKGENRILLKLRGNKGIVKVMLDSEEGQMLAEVVLADSCKTWIDCTAEFPASNGIHAVYFVCRPEEKSMDLASFEFLYCC